MKNFAALAAAGTLAILATPAQAAETAPLAPNISLSQTELASPFQSLKPTANHRGHKHRKNARYDRRGRYVNPRQLGRGDNVWRGRNGNYYCKRGNGTTGTVIGAGLGALAGRTVDTRGDRTVGTLLGALAGGLLGRELTRGNLQCR